MSPDEQKKPFRRRQYMIEKSFQYRVIWRFVIAVVASIFVSHSVTIGYFKFKEWLEPASQDLMYFAGAIQERVQFVRVLEILWIPLLLSAAVGSLLVLIFAVFYSHRIAGPMFNLKRVMKQVGEGRLQVTAHIRKTDEFHDVEEAFNKMLAGLNQHLRKIQLAVAKLAEPDRKIMEQALREMNLLDTNE